jgi:aryl-alcohol dehydrogenase-like predicted oxidoreductase
MARVPTSSGLLEGHLTPASSFTGNDHRRHRPREWLLDGLRKVDQLDFLRRRGGRTLAQGAMKWILAQPGIACVVHTVNTVAQLDEWAAAGGDGVPDLDGSELDRVEGLYRAGFGLAASGASG